MKKTIYLFMLLLGIGFFWACEDENTNPVLDTTKITAPTLTEEMGVADLVLTRAAAAETVLSFIWDSIVYPLDQIPEATYMLIMDTVGSNFSDPIELAIGDLLSTKVTGATLNQKIIKEGFRHSVAIAWEFSVVAYIVNAPQDRVYSNKISMNITAFSDEVVVEPIYLLGGGTSAGWNNNADRVILAVYLPESGTDSTFAVVDLLTPAGTDGSDGFLKFVRFVGLWAPQWGTDATGTSESGPLVLRPTESEPDPAAIPVPDVQDDYLIKVDIVNLTYTISETVQTLHIIGDATDAVWDAANAIPMEKLAPGKFQLVANLNATASEGFKFLELQGQWAPMYGQDGNGTWDAGKLQYRPTESVADPKAIPAPPETGSYLIEVDIARGTYKVTAQ
ncbi:MAG: hypothetical protein CVU09_02460 [Bacteroidetes bacterium HGW-Bacteroidetes-4]|jgi:hypothetical protein|nr:MAG: hypothetical protein CVU09_02460 [Bacteroidetes bacterium HGW-Bacteroidetes-4]